MPEDERPITADYDVETGNTTYTPTTVTFYDTMHYVSPNGRYVTQVGAPSLTIDTWTGENVVFPPHSGATVLEQAILWHPTSEWLIKGEANYLAGGNNFKLIGVTNAEGTYWRELTACVVSFPCIGWLPTQVDVTQLPAGFDESVLLAPIEIDRNIEYIEGYGAVNTTIYCDPVDELWKVREDGIEVAQLHMVRECREYEHDVHVAVSPDNTILVLAYPIDFAEVWDLQSGKRLMRLNVQTLGINFSDDGSRLYTRSRRAILVWDVNEILERAGMRESG